MSKSKKIWFLMLTMLFITGCSTLRYKPDKIDKMDLEELLVSFSDLPDPYWITKCPSNIVLDRERTADYLFISYFSDGSYQNTCLRQEVFRYRSTRGAEKDFEYASTYFKLPNIPEEWTFQSERASESYLGCDDYLCYWIARYDRIVIDVRSWRTSDCMDIANFQEVLKIIDQRASQLIYDE